MVKCPRCGKMIEDGSEICPACKAEFTVKELKQMLAEKDAEVQEQKKTDNKIRAKHNANVKTWLGITALLFMILLPLDAVLLASTKNDIFIYGVIGIVVLWLLSCVWAVVKKVFACPFCGAPMGSLGLHSHCSSCGKRIF